MAALAGKAKRAMARRAMLAGRIEEREEERRVFIGRLRGWRVEAEFISPAARCAVEKWREVFIWLFLGDAKSTHVSVMVIRGFRKSFACCTTERSCAFFAGTEDGEMSV
jgi:hypothetical protein